MEVHKQRSRTATNSHFGSKHTSLAKKLERIRLLREAIERTNPRVVEPMCCHSQMTPLNPTQEKSSIRPPPTTPIGRIHCDIVSAKLQALKITEFMKKKQVERRVEIVRRLLFEQSLKKKVNPSATTKLPINIRQNLASKYACKRYAVGTLRKGYDLNSYRYASPGNEIVHFKSPDVFKSKNAYTSRLNSNFDENIAILKHHSAPINGDFLGLSELNDGHKQISGEEYNKEIKCNRYLESFREKIDGGKLQFDKGWFAKPAEIEFKYESNNPEAVYKKSIVITNTGIRLAYCGFVEVECNMLVHPKTFSGSKEIERIYPGMNLCFDLAFCTHGEIFGDFRAKACFLTRREGQEGYMKVPVLCRPTVCDHLEPSLVSTNIHFRKVSYWDKPSTQIITLTNPHDTPCKVYLDSDTDKLLGDFNENLRRFNKDKATYVQDKTYGRKIKNALSKIIVNYIFQYIFDNIFEPIQTFPRYFAQIPKNSKVPLVIKLIPQLVSKEDFIAKRINANHAIKNKIFLKNEITIQAKTDGVPILIEPHLLDFKIGLVGICLQQTVFTLTNTGKITIPLKVIAKRSLKKFITIRPKCLFALSGQSTTVSVCLKIRPGFEEAANKLINKDMRLLEFPIYIQVSGELKDKIVPLVLPAMAVLTNCFALSVSEKSIDFGTVNLSTSSSRRLKIVNQSSLLQFYGFLNVPNSIIIKPGCGFGYIYPGEVLNVDLIYSPSYEEIACNGRQKCVRNVIVLYTALSASHFKNIKAEIPKHDTKTIQSTRPSESMHSEDFKEETYKIAADEGSTSQNAPVLLPKTTGNADNTDESETMVVYKPLDVSCEAMIMHFGSSIYEEKNVDGSKPIPLVHTEPAHPNLNSLKESEVMSTRNQSNSVGDEIQQLGTIYNMPIECIATVVRPIMEFSFQKVILQPTACGSSSYATIILRERPQDKCVCGEISKKIKFTGRFYLTTNDESLNVQPISGNVHDNMSQKIFIEYRPTLEKEAIRQKAQELQLEAENKLLNESEKKIPNQSEPPSSKNTKTQKKTTSKPSSKRIPQNVVKIDDAIYQEARELLLKSLIEPIRKTVTIHCKLQIWLQNDHNDVRESDQYVLEEIECHVVCIIVKPDFIVKSSREVDFGLVAEGMRKTMSVEVENISENPIYLRVSHLNPIGNFSHSLRTLPIQCKNYRKIKGGIKYETHKCSVLIDPEEIHKIRITFSSNGENLKNFERMDVESEKTNVVLILKALTVARGVQFSPTIDFYKLECGFDGYQKVDVLVTSKSKALQHLSIKREYLKAIPLNILPDIIETKAEKIKSSKVRQEKVPSKGKSGEQTTKKLQEEEKRFYDDYKTDEKYEFEDLFSLTFEKSENIKSKKGKTDLKEKRKNTTVQEESINDELKNLHEIDLQPIGKCSLISVFSVKEADKLQNSVRIINEKSSLDLYETSHENVQISPAESIQDKVNSTRLKNDDLDAIAFYKNMVFVAKYNIILGLDTTLQDFYFVGKVKSR